MFGAENFQKVSKEGKVVNPKISKTLKKSKSNIEVGLCLIVFGLKIIVFNSCLKIVVNSF